MMGPGYDHGSLPCHGAGHVQPLLEVGEDMEIRAWLHRPGSVKGVPPPIRRHGGGLGQNGLAGHCEEWRKHGPPIFVTLDSDEENDGFRKGQTPEARGKGSYASYVVGYVENPESAGPHVDLKAAGPANASHSFSYRVTAGLQ